MILEKSATMTGTGTVGMRYGLGRGFCSVYALAANNACICGIVASAML